MAAGEGWAKPPEEPDSSISPAEEVTNRSRLSKYQAPNGPSLRGEKTGRGKKVSEEEEG